MKMTTTLLHFPILSQFVNPKFLSVFFALCVCVVPVSGVTLTINNDIPMGTVGHFRVDVFEGGESRFANITANRLASADIFTADVLFDY